MGLFDWFTNSDESVGKNMLEAYYDEASNFTAFTHGTFDAYLSWLNARVPDFPAFLGELVRLNYASTTEGDAIDRLVELANSSGGEATIPQITTAVGGRGDTVNWAAGVPEIAYETIEDASAQASEIAQNVGQGVLSTLNLTKYLPWILAGGAVLYIAVLAKGHGKILKK